MKRKILVLAAFCVIIVLPPLVHGYVYPNVGDDTAAHLDIFDKIKASEYNDSPLILSYRIVGYPLVWISNFTKVKIEPLFLWFNYISLILIGLTVYFVFYRLLNVKTGWLSLVVLVFGAQSILFQFYYGQIFNAINMGIILPFLIFFSVRYLTQKKVYQLVMSLVLAVLFGAFHTSGIYLPFATAFVFGVYLVYSLARRKVLLKGAFYLGGGILVLSLVGFLISITNTRDLWYAVLHQLDNVRGFPIPNYLLGIVSPTVLILIGFAVAFFKDIIKTISPEARLIFLLLCGMAVVLGVAAFSGLSLDPFRQALDLATVLALLVCVLVGSLKWKNQMVAGVVLMAIGFGLWHNLPTWFSYNSAITRADKEAIQYVSSLGKTYTVSPNVAYWIYDRFMHVAYSENGSDILIARNLPMTPRSDSENYWYQPYGHEPDESLTLLRTFTDGKVTVKVYTK